METKLSSGWRFWGSWGLAFVGFPIGGLAAKALAEVPAGITLVGSRVAVPGIVSSDSGILLRAPNLGWSGVDVAALLDLSGAGAPPASVGNEAELASASVSLVRPGRPGPLRDFIYLSGEIGIGGAVVLDGHPVLGRAGDGGEERIVSPTLRAGGGRRTWSMARRAWTRSTRWRGPCWRAEGTLRRRRSATSTVTASARWPSRGGPGATTLVQGARVRAGRDRDAISSTLASRDRRCDLAELDGGLERDGAPGADLWVQVNQPHRQAAAGLCR